MSQRWSVLTLASLITFASLVSSSSNNALQAVFSMGGIKGDVIFSQPQDNGSTDVMVNLAGVSENLTWSIHQLPMIYDGNAAMSCDVGSVFDPKMAKGAADYNTNCQVGNNARFETCAVGDLGKMLGDIGPNTAQKNHSDQNLKTPTRGPHSIMGRTLVLYSSGTPKACALITPTQTMKTAVAVFKSPVAGFVYLRQLDENSDTSVFVDLFFVNDAQSNSQFIWQINQGVVDLDPTDSTTYCKELGQIFNPTSSGEVNCNQTMQGNCPIGDLTSKHGRITVSVATSKQSSTKSAFTDTNLPLTGANTVIGESMVLFAANNPGTPVACAKIMNLKPKILKASFTPAVDEGVDGYFKFTQASPFDPTTAEINLRGLDNKAQGYHVHAYPSPEYKHLSGSASCSGLIAGDHWNPFNIDINTSPAGGTGTDDEYEIGDLSGKYGSFLNLTSYNKQHIDYNLPLFGINSIQGRSVVIHKLKIQDNNKRWVCDNLMLVVDPATKYVMKVTANLTGGPTLTGMIVIDQYVSSEENTAATETTIFIEVTYTDDPWKNKSTNNHTWDIHENPVGDDARAEEVSKRCLSLKGNFNPYGVNVEGSYSSACSPTNMLRCESGDLTKKHTTFMVGGGRQLYNDVNLPLFGRNSVVGHGITVHVKNMGNDRLGCANIMADQALFKEKSLEFVKKDTFSGADFVNVLSRALQIPKWRLFNIRTENADVDKCQIVKFGIIGNANQVSQPSTKFDDIVRNNPNALGKYGPSEECEPKPTNGARGKQVDNCTLFVVVLVASVLEKLRMI